MSQPRMSCTVAFGLALVLSPPLLAKAPLSHSVEKALSRGESADVLLQLAPLQLPALPPAVGPVGRAQRAEQVVAALRRHAADSQADLHGTLRDMGLEAESLWISNSVATRASAEQIEQLRQHPAVRRIDSNAQGEMAQPSFGPVEKLSANAVEPHLIAMRVPEAWALGARGQGVVLGGQDTGYDHTHPALRERYRGRNAASHDYHWYDGVRSPVSPGFNRCGSASETPCDDGTHGTHTMGTAIGDGGDGARIGVATDAEWIGCRNMDRGVGRPSTYLACFQFLLAPTRLDGSAPRPDLAPAVTVNSWACPVGAPPAGEDCAQGSFDAALAAIEAAGQLTVAAAGNGNAFCGSISAPPSTAPQALVVAATDNAGTLAPFSLWGPVTVDGSGRMKPDLAAPGVGVRSSVPGGGYALGSGTSMATPGVAGVAALMLGANPLLIGQPQATAALLTASARPSLHPASCAGGTGQQSPNPMFGHGRVDALAAVQASMSQAVSPAHSGAWYDPSRPGEGWILQILDEGSATLVWYSFPTSGSEAGQAWFIASQGAIDGQRIRFSEVSEVRGGRFGAGFEAAAIEVSAVGSLELDFSSCEAGTLRFSGSADYPDVTRPLTRLTALQGRPCGEPHQPIASTRDARSGAWFDPERAGEGWLLEALEGDAAALTWFTFDPEGHPAWLFGLGRLDSGRLQIDDLRRLEGGRFGADFDPSALRDRHWGSLQIDFDGCDAGTLSYAASDPGWGDGEHAVQRLTRLFDAGCTTTE